MTLEIGQSIVPGMKLFSILELSALNVRFTVPEAEIGKIAVSGHSSEVSGEMECVALDTVLPIRIIEKSVSASPITHTYEVTARIIGGSDILLPGMIGKVRVQSTDRFADRVQTGNIIIPAHCILLKPEGPTVWLAEEGKAQRRNIVIDGYRADGVLVKSGLQAGDRLITEGYQKLYLGCPVTEE
jgi:multidrug efflux pump subunit AcrA (membrane-fusion protein)